jgi:hypothetical protein
MKNYLKIILFIAFTSILLYNCKDEDPKPFKQNVALEIKHTWGDSDLVLNKSYFWDHVNRTDTITPTKLIYHINHLKLLTEDSQEIAADYTYYMFNFEENSFLPKNITFTTPKEGVKYYVNSIEFTIGVADSAVNADNLLGGQFISPMYWGMIQGYINFKFEALNPKVSALIYHIGGYLPPYQNSRKVRIAFNKPYLLNQNNLLTLNADIFKFLSSVNSVDIEKVNLIHEPNAESKLLAENIPSIFSFLSLK